MDDITILCVTWNTQSLKLRGEDMGEFWNNMEKYIKENTPAIIAICFQEDAKPGSYVQTEYLPIKLRENGYLLLENSEMMGVGKTTFDGLFNMDFFMRGLRTSVYIKNSYSNDIILAREYDIYTNSVFRNKGAIGTYCKYKNKILAIINVHLPFNSKSLKETKMNKDKLIRQDAITDQNTFYNSVYRNLVLNVKPNPTHLIMMGDFNYRIEPFINWSAVETGQEILNLTQTKNFEIINKHDEYYQQINKKNIYVSDEGINNKGPEFYPTCKMRRNRENPYDLGSFNFGDADCRVPSYCDRILYQNLQCLKYERYDEDIIKQSDHAAIIGVYKMLVEIEI